MHDDLIAAQTEPVQEPCDFVSGHACGEAAASRTRRLAATMLPNLSMAMRPLLPVRKFASIVLASVMRRLSKERS